MNRIVAAILSLFVLSAAQSSFVLESELRVSHIGDATIFSAYSYDDAGNRTYRRVFDGADGDAPLLSTVLYEYDIDGNLIREVLMRATGDTESVAMYGYDTDGLRCAKVVSGDGTTRYIDSLTYVGGKLMIVHRYRSDWSSISLRRYGYCGTNLCADTLFEPVSGNSDYQPVHIRQLFRNADGTVTRESISRFTGGAWYLVSTVLMEYSLEQLISVATYENDAAARRLLDSTAYAYDSSGNRLSEDRFDNDRQKTVSILFTWREVQLRVARTKPYRRISPGVTYSRSAILFDTRSSGRMTVFDAAGRLVFDCSFSGETAIALPINITFGRYTACFRGDINATVALVHTH